MPDDEKPKLLWHSNAPWASTGYGQQTALFCPPLAENYDVGISAFYGLEASRLGWHEMPVYPGVHGSVGNDTLPIHAKAHFGSPRDGTLLTLMDVWVLDPAIMRRFNTVCWCPVDHDPPIPKVRRFLESSNVVPLAMSRFGQDRLADLGALYCPHAVDCSVFQPLPKREARELTKIPQDAFVVGMVGANKGNPSRKSFPEALQAFKRFHDRHDDAVLYMHTDVKGIADGVDLEPIVTSLGLKKPVLFTNQERLYLNPYPEEVMAAVYSSMDVLLSPSRGEGFGIPVLEAQACGVGAIVSDFTAQPEVCGAGWHVDIEREWSAGSSWWGRPKVADIAECLDHAYSLSEAGRKELAAKARAHAETYHVDRVVADHMLPALAEVRERYAERGPVEVAA